MLPKPLILLPAFGLLLTLSLWVLDPVLQVFDRTRIADLTSNRRRHYTVITDDQYVLSQREPPICSMSTNFLRYFKSPGKASVDLSVIFPAYNEVCSTYIIIIMSLLSFVLWKLQSTGEKNYKNFRDSYKIFARLDST